MLIGVVMVAGSAMADGDVDAGKEKAASCVACHGAAGEGVGENPRLAGLDSERLQSAMQAYKSGENPEPMMGMLMKPLSDEDISDLAAYYASLPGG